MRLWHDDTSSNPSNIEIENPLVDEVSRIIEKLNNSTHSGMQLSSQRGTLSIFGGINERYFVAFYGDKSTTYGVLEDDQILDLEAMVNISIQGDVNSHPLHQTVNKSTAEYVALYFLKHNSLPMELTWNGNV